MKPTIIIDAGHGGCSLRKKGNVIVSPSFHQISVIEKCMRREMRDRDGRLMGKTGHGLSEEQLFESIYNLKDPPMVLKGRRDNTIVAVTEVQDDKGRNIIIALNIGKKNAFKEVISISSIYGRDEFANYIEKNISEGNLLAANKEKADNMLRSIGKWYPEENTFISYDSTIAYTMENVKYFDGKLKGEEKQKESIVPTRRQIDYAQKIGQILNIRLPEEYSKAAYRKFISMNQERYHQLRPTVMRRYTEEQIEKAKSVDILEYARSQGMDLKREGQDYRAKAYPGGFIITPSITHLN